MDGTVLPPIPKLRLFTPRSEIDADAIIKNWLSKLQKCFDESDFDNLPELFIQDCWWRDILGLAWDFTTKQGQLKIGNYLRTSEIRLTNLKPCTGGLKPALVEWDDMAWVQSAFTFSNKHGHGKGLIRLANDAESNWKAWIVFTQLESLNHQKDLEARRLQSRAAALQNPQINGTSNDAPVLIVGAGQAGVSLAARLQHMGIKSLLIERHAAVGDGWRSRYDSVTLNTPTFTDHYPFLKYPDNWPEWLTGTQAADFLQHYSQLMGLEILFNRTVESIQRSETDSEYTITIKGPNGAQTLHSKHVVLATGVYSDEPSIPHLPGQESFQGTIYHSSQRKSGNLIPSLSTKNVVVIGCSTSGHDVAQDFVNCGAKQVSMVQRHPIFALSTDSWKTIQLGLWNMDGLTTEEADLLGNSFPIALVRTMSIGLTRVMAQVDKEMLDGLRRAGMALRTGEDGYGLADHQLIKGGHYYIDQGASQMIIDGRIKIHCCEGGVQQFGETSITLTDGTSIDADVVVLATGFEKNVKTVRKLMGDKVADTLDGFGDLDSEQERSGWWRPTGVPGFWYMTGSFMWCRQFSQSLALQIAADIKGKPSSCPG